MMSRLVALFLPVLLLTVFASSVAAISVPAITVLPDKVSTNGAFLLIADPYQTLNESVRVYWGATWLVNGLPPQGTFPRYGSKYFCYFSNTDNSSTCGPSIFNVVGNNTLVIYAVNQDGTQTNRTFSVNVGDVSIQPTVFIGSGGNISIRWPINTFEPSLLYYKIYYANNFTELTQLSGSASSNGYGYAIDIPAGPGEYFVSLRIDQTGGARFGGTIVRVYVPSTGIPGSGGQVNGILNISPIIIPSLWINKTQPYVRSNYVITNLVNTTWTNLDVAYPSGSQNYIGVTLESSNLTGFGSMFFTLRISAQNSLNINTVINVTSNGTVIGQIPIIANVSVINECAGSGGNCPTCPSVPGAGISLDKYSWSGDYLAGDIATLNFTITNNANTSISSLSSSSSAGLSSLVTTQFNTPILPNGAGQASATLTSSVSGVKQGTITITSAQGSATIAVLLNFHSDISSSISSLQSDLGTLNESLTPAQSSAFHNSINDIDSDIISAQSYQSSGNYESAKESYDNAHGKFEALTSVITSGYTPGGGGTSTPIDMTTILIIVVVVVAAVVVFMLLKRRKKSGGEDIEEELSEEFGPLPPAEES